MIIKFFIRRWRCEGGYRDVLAIAIPLVLSTGAWSVQLFVDRMFMTWYSPAAIAAVVPAGILNFTLLSLFSGTAGYVHTFVAQYYGAGRYNRIGPAIWQGIYIAIVGGVVHIAMIPFAGSVFAYIGHEQAIRQYETIYFQVLCLGAAPATAAFAMSGFFAGRGKTWPVMWVNTFATAVNLVMDYALIFGNWGFPELGVKGAGIATVISGCFSFLAYLILISSRSYNGCFYTIKGWRFEGDLFLRLIRFGFPNGVQFFLDIAGFTAFILIIGRLGATELAATNIAINISTLAFMPMIGLGIAVSVLVGQNLGESKSDLAERSVYSGFHLTFLYMITVAALYVFIPNIFLAPFAARADPESFEPIRKLAIILLRFVAVYSLFDALNIIFASAVKGAGDTRYVMFIIVIASTFVLIIPSYVALIIAGAGIYAGWAIATTYIILLGFVFWLRFLGGRWKFMRVIEEAIPSLQPKFPKTAT